MLNQRWIERGAAVLICGLLWLGGAAQARAGEPETVMVTLHAKAGSEADLERAIAEHWATARRLNLVQATPHVTIRGSEEGNKIYFIDIFTWRDGSIPDAAPAEIRKIWDQMNALVEARGAHEGLEFAEVAVVSR